MTPIASSFAGQIMLSVLGVTVLVLIINSLHRYVSSQLARQKNLVDRINRLLPQTQCGQCGHPGCLPYARAISRGEAVNKCPPGGMDTLKELNALLNESKYELNPAHGSFREFSVAVVREVECIGCTKCIQACPVDAILGGPKLMHTVIESECTGCDLCVEPCPVDCIDMVTSPSPIASATL